MSSSEDERQARSADFAFLADGRERLIEGIVQSVLPRIRQAVEYEYADRLAFVGLIRSWWLRLEMRREVNRRVAQEIAKQRPSDGASYLRS